MTIVSTHFKAAYSYPIRLKSSNERFVRKIGAIAVRLNCPALATCLFCMHDSTNDSFMKLDSNRWHEKLAAALDTLRPRAFV